MQDDKKNNSKKDKKWLDRKEGQQDDHIGAELPDPEHEIEDAMRNDAPRDDEHTDDTGWTPATRN